MRLGRKRLVLGGRALRLSQALRGHRRGDVTVRVSEVSGDVTVTSSSRPGSGSGVNSGSQQQHGPSHDVNHDSKLAIDCQLPVSRARAHESPGSEAVQVTVPGPGPGPTSSPTAIWKVASWYIPLLDSKYHAVNGIYHVV
jgi:hypothetical protein